MTNGQKWFFLVFICTLAAIGLVAQQQYSGGSAQNISQIGGSNVVTVAAGVQKVGIADSAGAAITSTGAALDVNLKTGAISNTAFAVNAGTAKIGIVYPYTSCGTTAVTQVLVALPTVATAVTGSTACLVNLYLHNSSNSTAYTVTVTDGAGTPVPFLNAITINPLETREYNFPVGGPKFTTGMKWSASNVAVTGAVEMMQ